jgi:hypothetical protein
MIKLLQQAIYELYLDISKLDKKLLIILFGILLVVLLLQMMKMTRYGEKYTMEGFEDNETEETEETEDEEPDTTNANDAELKAMETTVDTIINEGKEKMVTKLESLDLKYKTVFPDDDEDKLDLNINKLNAMEDGLCFMTKFFVFEKYYNIISSIHNILTTNNDASKLVTLNKRLRDFNEIQYIDDFTSKYPTIQEQTNTSNRLRFIVEDLTLEDLKEQNFLTKCESSNAIESVSNMLGM